MKNEVWPQRSYKVNKAFYVYLSSVKPTLPQIVCALVSPIPTKREGGGAVPYLLYRYDVETQIKIKYDIKARFHVATYMLWRVCAIKKNLLIKLQPWLTFLRTSFVLVYIIDPIENGDIWGIFGEWGFIFSFKFLLSIHFPSQKRGA